MKRLLCALVLAVPALAFANCGNDKDVGNGCRTETAVSPSQGQAQAMAQAQAQLQLQAQQQAQLAVAAGGNAHATGGSATGGAATGGSATGGSGGNSNQSQSILGSGNSSTVNAVSVSTGEHNRIPVSTAYAPALQTTVNCAVAVTGGISLPGFSGTAGTAYRDENCVVLEQVKAVASLGDAATAMEMLCTQPLYNEARSRMGKPCRYVIPVRQAVTLGTIRDY